MALDALIMILGLLGGQMDLVIESSLGGFIVQRLKAYGIFIFIKEVFNLR